MILQLANQFRAFQLHSPALVIIANGTSVAWPLQTLPDAVNSLALLCSNAGKADVLMRFGNDATIQVQQHSPSYRVPGGGALLLDEYEAGVATAAYVAVMSISAGGKLSIYRGSSFKMQLFADPASSPDPTDPPGQPIRGFFIPTNGTAA